ncbi:MAG: DUF1538 domain-containing protein [Dehalococcoidales bacterium]|nr:DUF1538 domain-containing protein [Dehalococcoidales bacterium]
MRKHFTAKLLEVVGAILPLVAVVIILQFVIVRMPAGIFTQFLVGAAMVIVGMALFLLGLEIGILPMGKVLGAELPRRGSILLIIAIAFLIGFLATVADPDVMVLIGQIDTVSGGEVSRSVLIYVIAAGVGFFIVMALLRILLNVPIAWLFAVGYGVVLILALFTPAAYVPVAFDSGGVTTGPMTVPIILALGLGFSSVLSGKSALSDGFGLIGLASLGPIIGVMVMGMVFN